MEPTRDEEATTFEPTRIVLTRDLRERLDREASRQTTSRSQLIRSLCERGLRQQRTEDAAQA
jgi:metal-responsive CopG/Arc/MetJ family transcriptional regulator